MLAEGLRDHRAALSASLWAEYRIDLESPSVGLWRLAELVACLPAGCAFWRSVGGPLAWSTELHMLAAIEFRVRVLEWQNAGGKGEKPKAVQHPPYAAAVEADQQNFDRRVRLHKARYG